MMRLIVALIAVICVLATLGTGLEVLATEARSDATVFQQLVARITFGFSALIMVVALGFSAVMSVMRARSERVEVALKDIAASNAVIAMAHKAAKDAAEAPLRAIEAAQLAEEEEVKRARRASYRAELQGKAG